MAQVYFEYILFLIDLFHSLIFSRTKEEDQHHVKKPQTCCICPIGSSSAEHKNKTCTDVGGILFLIGRLTAHVENLRKQRRKRYQCKSRLKEMVLSIDKTEVPHFHVNRKLRLGR